MKRASIAALILAAAGLAHAQSPTTRDVRLRFLAPANAAESQLQGFRLYRQVEGQPEEKIELGNALSPVSVSLLRGRAYKLALTAYGPAGESERSNVLSVAAIPDAPTKLEIVIEVSGTTATLKSVTSVP